MEQAKLTVIICTHNPRYDYLSRSLDALRNQTLPKSEWRLVVVDNASDEPVAMRWDLSWHPEARHLHEPRLGLTYARLAAISVAMDPWLVFVDDDNVLAPDYLMNASRIAFEMPFVGVFSGKLIGEFEETPPKWLQEDLGIIAVRDLLKDIFSTVYVWDAAPVGAGMVIRHDIAKNYMELSRNNPMKRMLGRSGKDLFSGEDMDMVLTALDMGYAMGRFVSLNLLHLIPKSRLQKQYILRLCEGNAYSNEILNALWKQKQFSSLPWHLELAFQVYRLLFVSFYAFQKGNRSIRGRRRAKKMIAKSGIQT